MHLIIIQLQRQSPPVFGWNPSVKNVSPIHSLHRKTAQRPSHQCIQHLKFQSTFVITLHPILFEKNPCPHIAVLAKLKSPLVSTRSCRVKIVGVNWNIEVPARVPRLESNYGSYLQTTTTKFVTRSFWGGLHHEWCNLRKARICEMPKRHLIS
jgi:hypothetical protein